MLPWIKRRCIWIPCLWARCTHCQSCLYVCKTSLSSLSKPAPLDSRLCGLRAQDAALRLWKLANIPISVKNAKHVPCSLPTIHPRRLLAWPYTLLPFWRELVLSIYSVFLDYNDYAGETMCAEWKMVGFRRTSSMVNYRLHPTCRSPQVPLHGRIRKGLKGTQHTRYIRKTGNNWHWSELPGALFYKTDEYIQFKRTSQTAIVAELIVGHDGKDRGERGREKCDLKG